MIYRRAHPRLSKTVFAAILTFSIAVAVSFAGVFTFLFYLSQEHAAEERLETVALHAATVMNHETSFEDSQELIADQFEENFRYTLIDADGAIIYDSPGNATDNHAERPEVLEAKRTGLSVLTRYSSTLGEDTIYAAVALDSGGVLRVSEQRPSFFAVAESIVWPLCIALVLIAVLSVLVSRVLTRRIVQPLQSIDVGRPLENDSYEEMQPLLARMDAQQQQLVEQNRELARAENMRREFSANVSHEMKTPLQVIAGYAEILEGQELPSSDVQRFAGIMAQETAQMKTLIDDILELSRLDDPVLENAGKEEIELLKAVGAIVKELDPLAEKHEVIVRTLGSTVSIDGNPGLLKQMVSNIVSNAIRYSAPGDEVTITVGKTLLPKEDERLPEAFVCVKDTGCGIAPEDQEKIFERFYRVDKSRSKESGGTGLGLAIAKHAATFHGACITVESELGKGSVFTIHFPLDK